MTFRQIMGRRGIWVGAVMVLLGLFMSISACLEKRHLEEKYPDVVKRTQLARLTQLEHQLGEDQEESVGHDLNAEELMVVRIRHSRAGMSTWGAWSSC